MIQTRERARVGHIVALTALLTLSGCFYLTAINERPRARIQEKTQGPYQVGDEAIFSATGSTDDRSSSLKVSWQAFTCDPDGNCTAIDAPELLDSTASDFVVTVGAKGTLRVELELEDEQGASDKTTLELPVVNREPSVEVQISSSFPELCSAAGGYVLGLPVHLAAKPLDGDEDPLTTEWRYEAPAGGGSDPAAVTFERVDGADEVYELIGDVAGTWEVFVTTTDDSGASATASQEVPVSPDSSPCLERRTPSAGSGDLVFVTAGPKRFGVVSACDSLDPYPPLLDAHPQVGRATLEWSLATPATGGALVVLPGQDLGEVIIDPSAYSPGDHLTLRVEARDRRDQPVSCPSSEPTCSDSGSACTQRLTWEIEIR